MGGGGGWGGGGWGGVGGWGWWWGRWGAGMRSRGGGCRVKTGARIYGRPVNSLFQTVFDVGVVAQAAQPALQFLVDLALAQRVARLTANDVGRVVVLTPLEHLCDMPAEAALEGLADLACLQCIARGLKERIELAAAGGRDGVFRFAAGQFREIRAPQDLLAQFTELPLGLLVAHELVRPDQD